LSFYSGEPVDGHYTLLHDCVKPMLRARHGGVSRANIFL